MVPSGVELASATVRLVIAMLPRRYDRCSDATAPARSPGRGPVGRVDAERPGVNGVAEVEPEPGMEGADPGRALPDAVGDRLAGALAGPGAARDRQAPDCGGQLAHVERSSWMPQQVGEVAQADRIPEPHGAALVGDSPDIALVVEAPRSARAVLR